MVRSEITTEKGRIWMDENGIIHTLYTENSDVTLEDAKSEIETIDHLTGGKRAPTIVYITGVRSVSREARKYYSGKESARILSAAALIIGSPLSKILANFFIGINKPIMPVKLFTSEDDAIEWLKNYVAKEEN